MKSPPILILTTKLPSNGYTTTNYYKGSYLASSTSFITKTISTEGNDYIEFVDNTTGWRIKKSGWYLFKTTNTHNVSSSKESGNVESYLHINGQKEIMTYTYAESSQVVAQSTGNITLYINKGDLINYSYEPKMNGIYSHAEFYISALF